MDDTLSGSGFFTVSAPVERNREEEESCSLPHPAPLTPRPQSDLPVEVGVTFVRLRAEFYECIAAFQTTSSHPLPVLAPKLQIFPYEMSSDNSECVCVSACGWFSDAHLSRLSSFTVNHSIDIPFFKG